MNVVLRVVFSFRGRAPITTLMKREEHRWASVDERFCTAHLFLMAESYTIVARIALSFLTISEELGKAEPLVSLSARQGRRAQLLAPHCAVSSVAADGAFPELPNRSRAELAAHINRFD